MLRYAKKSASMFNRTVAAKLHQQRRDCVQDFPVRQGHGGHTVSNVAIDRVETVVRG